MTVPAKQDEIIIIVSEESKGSFGDRSNLTKNREEKQSRTEVKKPSKDLINNNNNQDSGSKAGEIRRGRPRNREPVSPKTDLSKSQHSNMSSVSDNRGLKKGKVHKMESYS